VYETWGDPESVGRVLLKLGLAAGYAGEAEEAVGLFARAAELLAASGESRLVLQARHNLANWLLESGDALEALARFERARPLYERFGRDPWSRLRRRWLEGKIHAGLGDLDTARAAFEEVRTEAARRELAYELAMVSLELAILHLEREETAEVRRLAGELVPAFHSRDLHRHALGALYLFHQAAQTETATATFTREVLRYLRRARNNPYLRFEPPGR
jgi:tetratricopeptide (TPR) repeat protein